MPENHMSVVASPVRPPIHQIQPTQTLLDLEDKPQLLTNADEVIGEAEQQAAATTTPPPTAEEVKSKTSRKGTMSEEQREVVRQRVTAFHAANRAAKEAAGVPMRKKQKKAAAPPAPPSAAPFPTAAAPVADTTLPTAVPQNAVPQNAVPKIPAAQCFTIELARLITYGRDEAARQEMVLDKTIRTAQARAKREGFSSVRVLIYPEGQAQPSQEEVLYI